MTSDPGHADDTEPFGGVAPSDSPAETDATGGLSTDQKPVPGPLFGGRLALVLTLMRSRVVRVAYLVTVLGLLAAALADQAGTLWNEVQRLSAPVVVGGVLRRAVRPPVQHDGVAGGSGRAGFTPVHS